MNLYPATIDVLVATGSVLKARKWEQPACTILLGVASTLLAVTGIVAHITSFLDGIGKLIFPFTAIMLVDWLLVQRRDTPTGAFFERPRRLAQWLDPVAGACLAAGVAFNIWFHLALPHAVEVQVPIPLVGALVAGALYALLGPRYSAHRVRGAT
jgi:purine-cytosine permease-like protein